MSFFNDLVTLNEVENEITDTGCGDICYLSMDTLQLEGMETIGW